MYFCIICTTKTLFTVRQQDPNGIAVDEARGVVDPHQQRPQGQERQERQRRRRRHPPLLLPSYYGRLS